MVLAGGQTGWAGLAGEEVTDHFQYFNFNMLLLCSVSLGVRCWMVLAAVLAGGQTGVAGEEVTDHFQSANFLSYTAQALITGATIQPS